MARQIKMPVKNTADKETEEEVFTQRKRPESGRYLLQVDKQTKGSYKTPEAAQSAAASSCAFVADPVGKLKTH